MIKYLICFSLLVLLISCGANESDSEDGAEQLDTLVDQYVDHNMLAPNEIKNAGIVILGTCQDAGSPQINCQKDCCKDLHKRPDPNRMVVSLGLIDKYPMDTKKFIIEATPDFPRQLSVLDSYAGFGMNHMPDGVFLTHAHIGHYTGLMYLGKEAMDAKQVPVMAMPRMKKFLETNGPWDQLVKRENILIGKLTNGKPEVISANLTVTPFVVPHRDEYSETVGYEITGPNKTALFIPDIDKWDKWEEDIIEKIKAVDYAFLDATFFDGAEINMRDISEIPHPFVIESMELLANLDSTEKSKVYFIHFNHTNPLLDKRSEAFQQVLDNGFNVAEFGDVFEL